MPSGGWRTTFALNVPPAVGAVLLGLLRLPKSTGTGGPSGTEVLTRRGEVTTVDEWEQTLGAVN